MPTRSKKATSAAAPPFKEKVKRPRRPRPDNLDAISAATAAALVGRTYPTQFNVERERRQLVLDPIEGLRPYPPAFLAKELSDETKALKAAFDSTHHLVVVEWGGSKPPGRAWEYSRRQCQAVRERGIVAELEARRLWDLPVLGADLRVGKRPRKTAGAPRSDQESPAGALSRG